MQKTKKLLSIIIFILMMFLYCIVVMAFLIKINFNHWLIEFIVYFILGIIWVFPSMYILRPFKKNDKKKNNSSKMKEVRKRIDKIDSQILPLMVKRSQLVNRALSLKTRKSEIIDSKRINEIKRKFQIKQKNLVQIQN